MSMIPSMLEVSTKSYIAIEMGQVFNFLFLKLQKEKEKDLVHFYSYIWTNRHAFIDLDYGPFLQLYMDQSTCIYRSRLWSIAINGQSLSLSLKAMDLVDASSIAMAIERESLSLSLSIAMDQWSTFPALLDRKRQPWSWSWSFSFCFYSYSYHRHFQHCWKHRQFTISVVLVFLFLFLQLQLSSTLPVLLETSTIDD